MLKSENIQVCSWVLSFALRNLASSFKASCIWSSISKTSATTMKIRFVPGNPHQWGKLMNPVGRTAKTTSHLRNSVSTYSCCCLTVVVETTSTALFTLLTWAFIAMRVPILLSKWFSPWLAGYVVSFYTQSLTGRTYSDFCFLFFSSSWKSRLKSATEMLSSRNKEGFNQASFILLFDLSK